MMKNKHLSATVCLAILGAFGIVLGSSCKKDKVTTVEICKPERIISDYTLNGVPSDRDTALLFYNDDDHDGFYDVGEGIQQVYNDGDNHTDYKWEPGKLTIEWWLAGTLLSNTSHTLDQNGRSVEEIRVEAFNGPTTTTLRIYNQEGRIIQTTTFSDSADQTVGTYEWENGNLKSVHYESAHSSSFSFYEYYPELDNILSTEILPIFGVESAKLVKSILSTSGSTSSYSYELDTAGKIKRQTIEHLNSTTSFKIESSYFYVCN